MLQKNQPIVVQAVANGFVVKPVKASMVEALTQPDPTLVFESVYSLNNFITGHFDKPAEPVSRAATEQVGS